MSETRWKKDGAKIYRDWNERIEQFNRLCGIDQMGYIELISFLTTHAMTTTRYRDIIQSLEHKHTQIVSCRKSEFVIRIWSSLTHLIMIFLWVLLFMKRQQQHQPQWTWNNGNGNGKPIQFYSIVCFGITFVSISVVTLNRPFVDY